MSNSIKTVINHTQEDLAVNRKYFDITCPIYSVSQSQKYRASLQKLKGMDIELAPDSSKFKAFILTEGLPVFKYPQRSARYLDTCKPHPFSQQNCCHTSSLHLIKGTVA